MNYADIKNLDIANGPGVRVTLFVSGCNHHCPGCFNEVTWAFDYGSPFTDETEQRILEMLSPNYVTGLTLLGGEPFDPNNQDTVLSLLRKVKEQYPEKSIWAFTGYTFDQLISGNVGDVNTVKEYLNFLDVLVDGPFVESKKNLMLRFRGSENQRLIDIPKTLSAGEVVLWNDWQGVQ